MSHEAQNDCLFSGRVLQNRLEGDDEQHLNKSLPISPLIRRRVIVQCADDKIGGIHGATGLASISKYTDTHSMMHTGLHSL